MNRTSVALDGWEYKNGEPGTEPGSDSEAIAQVAAEIKTMGGNVTSLRKSMEKSISDLQAKVNDLEAKGMDASKAEELNKLRTDVLEKAEALEKAEKQAADRLDRLETAMKRTPMGGDDGDGTETKAADDLNISILAARGELKAGADPKKVVDLEDYRAYRKSFQAYVRRDERAMSPDQFKALSVGSDPAGGYLTTPFTDTRVRTIIRETSAIRTVASVITIGTDAYEFYLDLEDADAGWVGETDGRSTTGNPEMGKGRIPVHEMYAKPRATQQLLDDSSIDVESWLGQKLGSKFGRVCNTAYVKGDGIKKPRGFLTYSAGTAWGQIEQKATGSTSGATYSGLIGIKFSLKEPYHPRAAWLMARQMVAAVMLLKDGDNSYIFRAANDTAGFPMSLMGYPLKMAADMPVPASNALSVAFGDFQEGYQIVDRHGIRTLRDPYSAKPFVEFYSILRTGGDVTNFEAIKLGKCASE